MTDQTPVPWYTIFTLVMDVAIRGNGYNVHNSLKDEIGLELRLRRASEWRSNVRTSVLCVQCRD